MVPVQHRSNSGHALARPFFDAGGAQLVQESKVADFVLNSAMLGRGLTNGWFLSL